MKKLILIVLGLLALSAAPAKAQTGSAPTFYTICQQVAVSTSTPVELTGNLTNPRALVWAVKITNLDGTANLCASQDPHVSCSSGSHHGETVAPASSAPYNFLSWVISMIEPWYVISNGASSTNAEVCTTQ